MNHSNNPIDSDAAADSELLAAVLLRSALDVAPQAPAAEAAAHLHERVRRRIAGEAAPQALPASGFLNVAADEGWMQVEGLPEGAMVKMLLDDGVTATWLGRLPPNTELPAHTHAAGPEVCLVLEGELWLDDVCLGKGDCQFAAQGTRHHSVRSPAGCTVLGRSASSEAPRPRRVGTRTENA